MIKRLNKTGKELEQTFIQRGCINGVFKRYMKSSGPYEASL